MTEPERELPRDVQVAWGLAERPRRDSRPGLSLDRITAAAIAIADADGLGAISMGRVAAELGFTTMSLYRHVDSKDQLLTLMVDVAIGPAPRDRHPFDTWRSGLAAWVLALTRTYMDHPWIVEIPISGPPLLPNALDWMDWALAMMEPTPLTPAERMSTILLLSGYARGQAQLTSDISRAQVASGRPQEEDASYARALSMLVDADRMPALHALVTRGLFSDTMTPEVEDDEFFFRFGMERILDGIAHHISRHRPAE